MDDGISILVLVLLIVAGVPLWVAAGVSKNIREKWEERQSRRARVRGFDVISQRKC